MPKRLVTNVIDIKTGKPLETPPQKSEKSTKAADAGTNSKGTKAFRTREAHKWEFKARFRRHAFGWKSQPAISRIKEAVNEIKKVARDDTAVGAEGAVLFLERLSPAIEHVDGSSGAIGSAVNKAISQLVPIIAAACVDGAKREEWLERLWLAHQEDQMPYLEQLGDDWGELCATPELASKWADDLIDIVRGCWSDDESRAFFSGTSACLSALLKAGRNEELIELLELERHKMWHYQKFRAQALANRGMISEMLEFSDLCASHSGSHIDVARTCEQILLRAGQADEAYKRYALIANRENSYLSTYRAIAKKYPSIERNQILSDLIEASPGEEGKWFATAKELGFFELAVELSRKGPCDPKTLNRAARDYAVTNPEFALDVGMTSLWWLFRGYGYDVTSSDVWEAYDSTMKAAMECGRVEQTRSSISTAVAHGLTKTNWVAQILAREFPADGG